MTLKKFAVKAYQTQKQQFAQSSPGPEPSPSNPVRPQPKLYFLAPVEPAKKSFNPKINYHKLVTIIGLKMFFGLIVLYLVLGLLWFN